MQRSDEQIKKDIIEQLYWDNRINASNIEAEVEKGKVVLKGEVEVYAMAEAARQDADIIPGVKEVESQLEVRKAKVDPERDKSMRQTAQDVLAYSYDLSNCDIRVDVQKGWLLLDGTVKYLWQKNRAEALVSELSGVLGITNRILVVPTEKTRDEDIAKSILQILDKSSWVDIELIDIKVKDGVVTLRGNVPDLFTRNFIYSTAVLQTGVSDVNNQLKIVQE